ncbi:MAG TPA: DUF134 domain-containing protein [Bacteroidales bacterium]|nr:DUF134 domain-containing protein [Bacteroidales bacterium]
MSPRIKVIRKVSNPPIIKGFKPYGPESGKQKLGPVNLLYEEYEAIRLSDYDILNHHQASVMMGISRPTFTRIYASALQKIAIAFVEGRQISIEGGKVYFDSDWYHCSKCGCYFNNPEKEKPVNNCPLCGSQRVYKFDYENAHEDIADKTCDDMCICPGCGFEQEHQYGQPCSKQICPHCKSFMKRKGSPNCRNFKNK